MLVRLTDLLLLSQPQFAGSLPRPPSVLSHLTDHPDTDIPPEVLRVAVQETVEKQIKVGVTLVGDGEMSKPSYVSYVTSRLEGFGGSDKGPGVADLADFPDFAKQQIELGAVIPRDSEYIKCCTGPVKYRDTRAVQQDLTLLKDVRILF